MLVNHCMHTCFATSLTLCFAWDVIVYALVGLYHQFDLGKIGQSLVRSPRELRNSF